MDEFNAPAYTWIASLSDEDADGMTGTTGLYSCSSCGAVVEGSTDGQHTAFHQHLFNMQEFLRQQAKDLDEFLLS